MMRGARILGRVTPFPEARAEPLAGPRRPPPRALGARGRLAREPLGDDVPAVPRPLPDEPAAASRAGAAGVVLALFGAGSLAIAPVAGRLADRLGAVRLMRVALVVSGVLLLLVPLARGPLAIAGLTLLIALTGRCSGPRA